MIPEQPDRVAIAADEKSQRLESLIKVSLHSTVLTPEALHDKDKTRRVLAKWGSLPVTEAVQTLAEKRLLTRSSSDRERIAPGRNYRLSERCVVHIVSLLTSDGHWLLKATWQITFWMKARHFTISLPTHFSKERTF